jgi:acetyltransferase-like isoleucine patch superfamily enzyme
MKAVLKNTIYLLFCILCLPIYGSFRVFALFINKDTLLTTYSQWLSLLPGQLGNYIRKASFNFILTKCHRESQISFGVLFSQQDTEINEGVYIGPQCNIGLCRIEKNCLLGSGVHIMSGKHQHDFSNLETPIKDQGGVFEKITVGEDSWIGNGALIMASVGKKCIVGAGAVVTHAVEDYSIVTGNPAKVVKKRVELSE